MFAAQRRRTYGPSRAKNREKTTLQMSLPAVSPADPFLLNVAVRLRFASLLSLFLSIWKLIKEVHPLQCFLRYRKMYRKTTTKIRPPADLSLTLNTQNNMSK